MGRYDFSRYAETCGQRTGTLSWEDSGVRFAQILESRSPRTNMKGSKVFSTPPLPFRCRLFLEEHCHGPHMRFTSSVGIFCCSHFLPDKRLSNRGYEGTTSIRFPPSTSRHHARLRSTMLSAAFAHHAIAVGGAFRIWATWRRQAEQA